MFKPDAPKKPLKTPESRQEFNLAAHEKLIEPEKIATGIHESKTRFGNTDYNYKYAELPDKYKDPAPELALYKRQIYLAAETRVNNQPFFKENDQYVEVAGKILPKSREFNFEDGTRQVLCADYDEKGRDIGYRELVNGKLRSESTKKYGPDGRLVSNGFVFYDADGEANKKILFELRGKKGEESMFRVEGVRQPDGNFKVTGDDIPAESFRGQPLQAEDYALTIKLAKNAPGETEPRKNYHI